MPCDETIPNRPRKGEMEIRRNAVNLTRVDSLTATQTNRQESCTARHVLTCLPKHDPPHKTTSCMIAKESFV